MARKSVEEKENKVFEYLRSRMSDAVPPTVREIATACGIRSTSTVHDILGRLENEGKISRDKRFSRAIRIEGAGESSQVPVLGRVTAGLPILAVENIDGYIPYPIASRDSQSVYALRVSGLSMRDAGILDGDIIVADQSMLCYEGDIVVGLIEGEATVKRLHLENDQIVLMPENPDFQPIRAEKIDIIGRVIGSYRNYQ